MDRENEKACSPKQKAGSVAWNLIALVAIAVASWTVKTTFGPDKHRYFQFESGNIHVVWKYNTETGQLTRVFPPN